MLKKILFLFCLYPLQNLLPQEISSYIERGNVDTVYAFIRNQCESDSIAILIWGREYIIEGETVDTREISKRGARYIKDFISTNRNRTCVFRKIYRSQTLLE